MRGPATHFRPYCPQHYNASYEHNNGGTEGKGAGEKATTVTPRVKFTARIAARTMKKRCLEVLECFFVTFVVLSLSLALPSDTVLPPLEVSETF